MADLSSHLANINAYPCDRGGSFPVGYHKFVKGQYGTVCEYCGATPKVNIEVVWADPAPTTIGPIGGGYAVTSEAVKSVSYN